MEPAQLIKLALTASIPLLVFALGARATFADTTTLFRELFRPPNRLLRALVAMYVVVPVAAVAIAMPGDLTSPVKVALLAMAIVLVPLGVHLVGRAFDRELHFPPIAVARLIGITILAPLIAGLALRHAAPRWAASAAPWASRLGTILLVAGLLPVLVQVWPAIASMVGDGSVAAIAAVVAVAIAAGHGLGRRDAE